MIFVILKKLYVKCLDINSKIKEFFYHKIDRLVHLYWLDFDDFGAVEKLTT